MRNWEGMAIVWSGDKSGSNLNKKFLYYAQNCLKLILLYLKLLKLFPLVYINPGEKLIQNYPIL